MVHHVPDAQGKMDFHRDSGRCGFFIANLDEDETLTVEVDGNPSFTLVPQSYIRIADSVGLKTSMTNDSRNYTVLEYVAGSEF
jgi:hypothetical protein